MVGWRQNNIRTFAMKQLSVTMIKVNFIVSILKSIYDICSFNRSRFNIILKRSSDSDTRKAGDMNSRSSCCESFMTPFCHRFLVSSPKSNSFLKENPISYILW